MVRSSASFTTTNRARSSNVATLTLSGTHGWAIEDIVEIVSVGGTGYNGVAEITAVTSNTFSYAST